jgi:hypothetical protein
MSAEMIMDAIAELTGWSVQEQLDAALEYIDNQGDEDTFLDFLERSASDTVLCKLCGNEVPGSSAHLHQNGWVGLCCWDERLRSTE